MIFRKRRQAREPHYPGLGPLERSVMETLWREGGGNVRDVTDRLGRPLAYTTVMTTLDRLYKKGLLERRKQERAFWYVPRLTRGEWERGLARSAVEALLAGAPRARRETIMSCLLEGVSAGDVDLLRELERKIQQKRIELEKERDRS